jgi:hypothetical protein
MSDSHRNLLGGPPPTYLPDDSSVRAALADGDPAEVASRYPDRSAPWAVLADQAFAAGDVGRAAAAIGEDVEAERCRQFLADSDPEAAEALG